MHAAEDNLEGPIASTAPLAHRSISRHEPQLFFRLMTTRFALGLSVAVAAFVVTLILFAWHERLWGRPAEPLAAVTQPAPAPAPVPVNARQPEATVDSVPVQPEVSNPVPVPPTREREQAERSGEARSARTR